MTKFTASTLGLRSSKEGKWVFREDDTGVIILDGGRFEDGASSCCVDLQFTWDDWA